MKAIAQAALARRLPPVRQQYMPFRGGLNEVDPQISMDPGMLIAVLNYEVGVRGGYRRIDGYERYSGLLTPSDATYWIVPFDSGGTTAIVTGNTAITVSGRGKVLVTPVLTSGSWAGGDAAGYLVLGKIAGFATPAAIQDNEAIKVAAVDLATVNGSPTERAASSAALDATYQQAAIEELRALIPDAATPGNDGSGAILGVWIYAGDQYCFRNNTAGTAALMLKADAASASGWSVIDLGGSLAFTSGGATEPSVGDTITGDTSTETAVITRIVLTSGSWAGSDAAGTIYYRAKSGAFTSGEDFDTNNFTMTGAESDVSLSPDGAYHFYNANFVGAASGIKMYGVDGVNLAFEFDGTSFLQIATGMSTDTPVRVAEHKKQLHLAFPNGSLQQSSIGDPFGWSVVTGAAEIGTADEITDLLPLPGDVLGVFNRNRTYVLYGGSGTYELVEHSDTTGAIAGTVQRLFEPVYVDDRGITTLSQTQRFGDFQDSTISQLVIDTIKAKKSLAVASCVVREKNQYRVFFSDKTALYVTFDNRQVAGITLVKLAHVVSCICSEEDGAGNELILFGSDDGYVYRLDQGTSFDGAPVQHYMRPVFNNLGTPGVRKAIKRVELEMKLEDESTTTLRSVSSFSYEDADTAPQRADTKIIEETFSANPLNTVGALLDGQNDSLSSTGLTGAADGKQGLLSFWVKRYDGAAVTILDGVTSGNTGRIRAQVLSDGRVQIIGRQVGTTTTILSLLTSDTITADGLFHHVAMTWDLASAVGLVYIDGEAASLSGTILTDETLDYTHTSWTIGQSSDGTSKAKIGIAEAVFAAETVDLSDADALETLIVNGDPNADLGSDGSNVTGTQPLVYLTRRRGLDFEDNAGSGGAFTVSGALANDTIQLVPDDATRPRLVIDVRGSGQNVTVTLYGSQIYESPHTIFGAIIYYTSRRRARGLSG